MIEAKECWHTSLAGFESGFPKNLIIPEQVQTNQIIKYSPKDFKFVELNSNQRRMFTAPLSIVWMPNNNCYTSCEYCYADRKHHQYVFSIEKIERFIKDAKASGVAEIMLTGGDFFENPHWRDILRVLKNYGYNIDMISTKKPLSYSDLSVIKSYGVRLQISFDTVNEDVAMKLLHTKDGYVMRVKKMLKMADDLDLDFQVATVLTNMNDHLENLESLLDFLSKLKNIRHWEIRVAFRSLYTNTDFCRLKSSRKQITDVAKWIEDKHKDSPINT